MASEEKHQELIHQTSHKNEQGIEETIARKRVPVSFMEMNNSHKTRHEKMQKKLENVV